LSQVAPWDTWGYPVPPGTTAATLSEQAERETSALLAAIAALSVEQLERPGTFDKWSARDVVAHCVAWAEMCAQILGEIADGTLDLADYQALPVGDETGDELNEQQVMDLRGITTSELSSRLERAGRGAAQTLRGSEADPPAQLVLLTVGDHFAEHATDLRGLVAGS